MQLRKLSQMSVGPLWVLRKPMNPSVVTTQEASCAVCGQPWLQSASGDSRVIIVLAAPIIDFAQQTLLQNCLRAVGWDDSAVITLHTHCASSHEAALQILQTHLLESAPRTVLVFGAEAAQRLHPEFNRGRIHHYQDARLVVTWHPEQVLADLSLKAAVWADLCLAAYAD